MDANGSDTNWSEDGISDTLSEIVRDVLQNVTSDSTESDSGRHTISPVELRRSAKKLAVFSFPLLSKPIRLPLSTQKSLIANTLFSHKWFSKGYVLQTYEAGVLYPVLHFLELPDDEESENVCLMDRFELGNGIILYQSLYEEISRIDIPVIVAPQSIDVNSSQAYIIIGIKTLDQTFNRMFEDNWKDLSGARNIYLSLSSDYGLCELILYRRLRPQDCSSFVYILLVKLNNVTIENHVFLLDYVHRLRLRMLGYLSLYGHYVEKTAVVHITNR